MDRTHLVCHRTDAADPCGDIGHILQFPAAQQRFKQPRRFEDMKPNRFKFALAQLDIQSAFALDAGHHFDADRSGFGGAGSPLGGLNCETGTSLGSLIFALLRIVFSDAIAFLAKLSSKTVEAAQRMDHAAWPASHRPGIDR
jgi:hypothetical protein